MDIILAQTIGLLCVAVLVAMLARRINLPYTVGLVVTGIGLALMKWQTGTMLTHEFIFDVMLPPLLFEAALSIHWKELRRDMLPILTLSTIGVLISTVVVAAGMVWWLHWPPMPALVFGVLIAATDPIAVIAMFKDNGIRGRLRLLVESESLFNDGVAALLFAVVLAWVHNAGDAPLDTMHIARTFLLTAAGGIMTGLGCGALAIAIAGKTTDYLVETTVTAVAAYGSFLLAEHFKVSGVLATVAAGLLMGNVGAVRQIDQAASSSKGHAFVVAFWDFAAFIANSLIFLLIGLAVAGIPFEKIGATALLGTIGLVLAGRALTVYPLCLLFSRSQWAVPMADQHVLWWGGLRGALALALALALPPALDHRDEILIAAFGVVAFSVVVQGLTMSWLLKRVRCLKIMHADSSRAS